jgi:hypothetical protein
MGVRHFFALALLASAPGCASCQDESGPVDVPFEGADPRGAGNDPARKSTAASPPDPRAAQGAEDPTGSAEPPGEATKGSLATGLESCCAALRSASRGATGATKAQNAAAANACETQRRQVALGKVTLAQAKAAVRASLAHGSPATCR